MASDASEAPSSTPPVPAARTVGAKEQAGQEPGVAEGPVVDQDPKVAQGPVGEPEVGGQKATVEQAAPAGPEPPHLTLIGTGHVFRIEAAVQQAIEALRPEVVFVELDPGRLNALMQRRRGESGPNKGGLVHRRLQAFQERIASLYGAEAGGEMLAAVEGARRVGARVLLVDRPAEVTLKRLMKQLTWRERGMAAWMFLRGSVQGVLPRRRSDKESIEDEIRRYGEDPEAALAEVGRQFPTVRRVLIDERDELMASRIHKAMEGFRNGVAVVGDGHVGGMVRHLERSAPDARRTVYRLADVRDGRLPKPEASETTGTPSQVSFGFTAQV